jgi:hypothetical protein
MVVAWCDFFFSACIVPSTFSLWQLHFNVLDCGRDVALLWIVGKVELTEVEKVETVTDGK